MEANFMKRFIISTLAVAVFFVGLGALVERTGAKLKSDDKALELVAKARQAIGGDTAIKGIQSLHIVGTTTRKITADGEARTISGDTEIAMQFPDRFMQNTNITDKVLLNGATRTSVSNARTITVTGPDSGSPQTITVTGTGDGNGQFIVKGMGHGEGTGVGTGTFHIVLRNADGTTQELTGADAEKWIAAHKDGTGDGREIVMKRVDGATAEHLKLGDVTTDGVVVRKMKTADGEPLRTSSGENIMIRRGEPNMAYAHMNHNDFFRTALGLLMTTPEGADVSYTFAGRADLDGTGCNVVVATIGGDSYKLFLDESSNLPIGMTFRAEAEPHVVTLRTGDGTGDATFNKKVAAAPGGDKDVVIFTNKLPDGADAGQTMHTFNRVALPAAEYTVRFSDYRDVNGVQLPFRWTTTGGNSDEVFTVTSYEVNPANISQKFERQPAGEIKLRKAGN